MYKKTGCYFLKISLRARIDAVLINAARDLRTKADNVVRAFNQRISTMDEARIKLETELIDVSHFYCYLKKITFFFVSHFSV